MIALTSSVEAGQRIILGGVSVGNGDHAVLECLRSWDGVVSMFSSPRRAWNSTRAAERLEGERSCCGMGVVARGEVDAEDMWLGLTRAYVIAAEPRATVEVSRRVLICR